MKTKKFYLTSERIVYKLERFVVDVPEFITKNPEEQTLGFFMSTLLGELVTNPEAHAELLDSQSYREVESEDWDYGDGPRNTSGWEEVPE